MKKISFLALAAVGLLFGACASDSDVAEKSGNETIESGKEGFIGIALQLPNSTTPSLPTRSNDDYNDGDATEYAVKSGKVLFFKGATEATATFIQAQSIIDPKTGWNLDGSTYVTSTKIAVAKLDNVSFTSSEQLFAYVVLNYEGTALESNPAVGANFATYSQQTIASADTGGSLEGEIASSGLLMTNAPIANKQGGSVDPTGATITLAAQLDKALIKNTKEEAESAPAGCVYVERAAAKVTLEVAASLSSATDIDMKDASNNKLTLSTSDIKWQIINVEDNFYNGRQANVAAWLPYINPNRTNANSEYRFVSNDLFSPTIGSGTHTAGYRTYFAQDPTYTTDHDALTKPVATDDDDHWLSTYAEAKGKRAYVPENTFPTRYQTSKNTTQATVRVQFNGGSDFYTISNDALYYNATNAKNKLAANIMADYYVNDYMTQAATNISTAKSVSVTGSLEVALTTTTAGDVVYSVEPKFGSYGVTDITDATLASNLVSAITRAVGDNKLSLYKNGYAYYNVRIKHFGDVETPWASDGAYVTQPGTTTEQIYKLSDTNYGDKCFLGRYGIVRDNWYKLSIDGITKLGSATPPNVTGDPTPDDEIKKEYYISAHVHILPWVLRTQSVHF